MPIQRTALLLLVTACNVGTSDIGDGEGDGGDEALACEDLGLRYTGIGGRELSAGRVIEAPYSDRRRMKPYGALTSEYQRTLGNQAADVKAFDATFGSAPPRWFEEPEASANTLYASFTLAFQGCLELTAGGDDYAAAPTEATARAACAGFARRFWDRAAAEEELQGCVDYAVAGTESEAEPRRRWAYACASVMTAAGFLSY